MSTHNTPSAPKRIDVARAAELIAAAMPNYGSEQRPLENAVGCLLSEDLLAERDQPPFDRATMDGIAIHSAALNSGTRVFSLQGIQAAGHARGQLLTQQGCMEIMTGAVMPQGADCVVPIERVSLNTADSSCEVEANYRIAAGQFVHRQASDHSQGECLLRAGTLIRGPEMAILTAGGQSSVAVARWPRIAVISTGDELVDVGTDIAPHQIRSSNDRAIAASLHLRGCRTVTRRHLGDDPDSMLQTLEGLHDENELLILSGGVSMGKYDYVPRVLEALGVTLIFHKVLQRPGLPMWFGVSAAGKPVFALPGNPVSTLVCFHRYVLPALALSMGQHHAAVRPCISLQTEVEFAPDLCWFLPVSLHTDSAGISRANPCPTNTSGDFVGLRGTDGFVELPRGRSVFPAGYSAEFYPW